MSFLSSFLQISTQTAPPVQANGLTLTPRSQVVRLTWPHLSGGLIWQRPIAVEVTTSDGQVTTLPVRDVTRQTQIALLLAAVAGVALLWAIRRRSA